MRESSASELPDPPLFTPVPTRARHDGWTPERQRDFLVQLARLGLVGPAARAVGMSRKAAYALRARPGAASFAAAWDACLDEGRVRAFGHAIDRALNGVSTPVLYRGRVVARRVRFNDRLLIAAMRGERRPGTSAASADRADTTSAPASDSGAPRDPAAGRR